jgi:hypothetical protein
LPTETTKPVETLVQPAPAARPNKVAANEKGLAFVGELEFRLPITEAQ